MKRKIYIFLSLLAITSYAKKVLIGGSGGYLNYPNATTTLALSPGDTIGIKAGTYTGFTFEKLKGSTSKPIVIINEKGIVSFTGNGSSYLRDVNNVTFTGTGVFNTQGFHFHDINNRALQLENRVDSVTISHCKFDHVSDYTIRVNASMKYDGTLATVLTRLKFLHLSFSKVGTPIDWGNFAYAADLVGVGKDVEIAYCTVDSLDKGDGFRLNKVFNVNIHHNKLTNTGLQLVDTHPGAIYVRGNGQLHHNYFHNLWGNGMRLQGVGLDGTGTLQIFNNIIVSSRKYSAIEVQTHPSDLSTVKTVPYMGSCNYYIDFNTMGNQSARDYHAGMVDVYTLGGAKCYIRNNLGFNIEKDQAHVAHKNYIYNRQSQDAADIPDTSNNIYRRHYSNVGLADTLDCYLTAASPAIDKAITLANIKDDFEGLARNQNKISDIGAREYNAITDIDETTAVQDMLQVYPNPSERYVDITCNDIIKEIKVQNTTGQLIHYQKYNEYKNETMLDLQLLDAGLYFLIIDTDQQTLVQSLMIKKH